MRRNKITTKLLRRSEAKITNKSSETEEIEQEKWAIPPQQDLQRRCKEILKRMRKKNIQIEKPLDLQKTKQSWQEILEEEVEHNKQAQKTKEQEQELTNLTQME